MAGRCSGLRGCERLAGMLAGCSVWCDDKRRGEGDEGRAMRVCKFVCTPDANVILARDVCG